MIKILILLFLQLLCTFSLVEARNWQLEEKLKPYFDDKKFIKFEYIDSEKSISFLLETLNQMHPFLSARAVEKEGIWYITGELADKIKDVEISFVTKELYHTILPIKKKFIGTVDTLEQRKDFENAVKAALKEEGYVKAVIHPSYIKNNYTSIYKAEVIEHAPSSIKEIKMSFTLPDKISIAKSLGPFCNLSMIKKGLDSVEDKLRESSYFSANLNLIDVKFSDNLNSCSVLIDGVLGYRVNHIIKDSGFEIPLVDLKKNELTKSIDFEITDPELMKEELIKYYTNKGFEDIVIKDPKKRENEDNTTEYIYEIIYGPSYFISDIKIEGNASFSHDEILKTLDLDMPWFGKPKLNRLSLARGIDKIKGLYDKAGYWDAVIYPPKIIKDVENHEIAVVISIKEGLKHVVKGVFISGNKIYNQNELYKPLEDKLNKIPELAMHKELVSELEEAIYAQYIGNGYLECKVVSDVKIDLNENIKTAEIYTHVHEGQRIFVGNIRIMGNNKTADEFILRYLHFKSGDWYNIEAINNTRKDLMELGLFSSVQINSEKTNNFQTTNGFYDIKIELVENESGRITFGPGFNLNRGLNYVSEFSLSNFMGNGRKLSTRVQVSEEREQFSIGNVGDRTGKTFLGRKLGIGYLEPFLLNLPIHARLSFSHLGEADSIWKISNTIETSISHEFRGILLQKNSIGAYYKVKLNRDEGSRLQDLGSISTGNSRIGAMGLRYSLDQRDYIAWPSKGFLLQIETEWARSFFSGDFNYFKPDISFTKYFDLGKHFSFATSWLYTEYQHIEGNQQDDVLPSSERLVLTGNSMMRGFKKKLGPMVLINGDENDVGGDRRLFLKNELRYRYSETIGMLIFFEIGNVHLSRNEKEKFESSTSVQVIDNYDYVFDDLFSADGALMAKNYVSTGLGCSYISPLGAINLSLGFPVKEPNDSQISRMKEGGSRFSRMVMNFSIGADF